MNIEQVYASDFVEYVVDRYKAENEITTDNVDELTESVETFIRNKSLDHSYCDKKAGRTNCEHIEVIKELKFYDWNEWTRYNYDLKNIGQVAYAAIDNTLSDYGWNVLYEECAERIIEESERLK